jgi:ATP-binding cassette, subfamily B, bacterial PglK
VIGTLARLRALFGTGHPGRWWLVLALAVLVAALEAVGAVLVLVLLGALADGVTGTSIPLLGDLAGWLPGRDDEARLLTTAVLVGVFFLIRGAVLLVQHYVHFRVTELASAELSTRLFDGYLAMPATFHLERSSSELVRNAIESVNRVVQEGLVPALQVLAKLAMVAAITTVLLVVSPVAALGAAAVLGSVAAVVVLVIQPRVKRWGRTVQTMTQRNIEAVHQSLAGWRDIRILGRRGSFVAAFDRDRRDLARAIYLGRTAREVPRVVIETGVVVAIAAFVVVTVATDGTSAQALPVLGLFGYAAVRLMPELSHITASVNSLRFVGPAIDDLHADLARFAAEAEPDTPAADPLDLRDAITLEGVGLRYPGAEVDALAGVDGTVPAGSSLGIIGPTGGGKSTLLDVILGLLEPTSGRVLVDGVDVRDQLPAWHASIGTVPQVVFIADDTVRRNVALGVPDEDVDETAVLDALRLAQLDGFVAQLPAGLDTVVGERGARISGGQRQRLAIARALYRRPSVLVLDEGTSALDDATEADLVAALAQLPGARTTISVAHRLSSVAACDRIWLVRDGVVADRGTFAEVAARNPDLLVPATRDDASS